MIITVEIKYSLIGTHYLKYLLELSNKREIVLNIQVKCFEPGLGKISLSYPNVLDMGQVAIDEVDMNYFV